MSERDELNQAISALEAQRATLGDAIVDASQSALREKIAALEAANRPDRQRKQATILFMDVASSTSMVHELDPEDNLAMMDTALRQLSKPVAQYGGRVTRFMGDGFMALFGHPVALEHDPDNAVRAGLAILEEARIYAREIETRWGVATFNVRVGIDTGLVVIGGDTEAENTMAGATINLAARLESAAKPGTVLVSHNTFQHVRGVFDLQPLQPIEAKGFAEPVLVYQVLKAKTRSFRTRRRGVEGVETQLIGREGELKALQDAYHIVLTDNDRQMITIAGEAGLGKSRLLYEFENWVDLQPETVTLFRGRARQETERQPYSLFRDLFAFRFGVRDDDSAEDVRQKFVSGFQGVLGDAQAIVEDNTQQVEMKAHFAGHLLGYDFGASLHIQPLSDDPQQLRDRALLYLIDYFKAAASKAPLLVLMEDLHWADNSSLDSLIRLVMALHEHTVLLVSAARPNLYERRPHWMEGHSFHLRLDLRPLSRIDSRLLTQEVLQKVTDIPGALRDLIVVNAEGNPFFVEELVKMLIDEGVVIKGEPAWQVVSEKLSGINVPSTLAGVLQARLDALTEIERIILQRASVVGRVFWERLVAYLNRRVESGLDDETVASELLSLRDKEMVFHREMSTFAGEQEYIFKHALLRDVAYESVLKEARQDYHTLAAEWLIERSSERAAELSGLVADHLERAGRNSEALTYLRRAGEDASQRYAHEEAAAYFDRAFVLVGEGETETRYELLLAQEHAYDLLGKRDAQRQVLDALQTVVDQMGNAKHQATVATRQSGFLLNIGDYRGAIEAAQKVVGLAGAANDYKVSSDAHRTWGFVLMLQGHYQAAKARYDTALDLAQMAKDAVAEAHALNGLGTVNLQMGEFDVARDHLEHAAELTVQEGHKRRESEVLINLGDVARSQREYESARSYFGQSYAIARDMGDQRTVAFVLNGLGYIDALLGRYADAERSLAGSLTIAREIGQRRVEAYSIINLALVAVNLAEFESAKIHAERALEIVRAIDERSLVGYTLTYLAQAFLGLGDTAAAEGAYNEAVAIHRELEQHHLAMEPLAGLAEVAMVTGHESTALLYVEEILDYLEKSGTLDGAEEPLRVYLICYQVLHATQDPRAIELLSTAYELLQTWAAKVSDEATKRSFLENVPWHRKIAEATQIHHL